MQNSSQILQPQQYKLTSPYLSIDLSKIRAAVVRAVSESGNYFSQPLDDAGFEIVSEHGVVRREVPIEDISQLFDLIDDDTAQIKISLSIRETTKNLGMKLPPQEYIYLAFDFSRRSVYSTISILGLSRANQVWQIFMDGVTLMKVQLNEHHQYIEPFLYRFLEDHPNTDQNVFLIMRFENSPPFPEIIETVRNTCAAKGLKTLRADDREYTDDLWDNVLTYMYGCDYAIAIFDYINYQEFNPNVALEVGFLLAQCKRVLLLKDKAIPVMPADIVGKIYRSFDTYDARNTIPPQINKWLDDYGIGELS